VNVVIEPFLESTVKSLDIGRVFNQGDHLSKLSGKPGNVRKFDSCQGSVRKNLVEGGKLLLT